MINTDCPNEAIVMPGQAILIKVFLDEELDDSEAVAPEILFDDVRSALSENFIMELVGKA